jgi:Tfp pilus assembly protein FimT
MKTLTLTLPNVRARGASRPAPKKLQRGFDLAQLALVMIVIAVIGGAAYYFFNKNMTSTSVAKNSQYINNIAAGARKNLGAQNLYSSLTTTLAVSERIIPEELKTNAVSPWTAGNSYGGDITLVGYAAGLTTAFDTADLTWNNVPSSECNDIVMSTANSARQIKVAGTIVKPTDSALNVAKLTTQCESATTVAIDYFVGR